MYGADNQKIDSIERVMIDKQSGKVSYAMLGFGGFLGMATITPCLAWQSLKYDTDVEGYRTDVSKQQLEGAPKYADKSAGIGKPQPDSNGQRLLSGSYMR